MEAGSGPAGPWCRQAGQTHLLAALALLPPPLELLKGDLPLQVIDQLRAEARHRAGTARTAREGRASFRTGRGSVPLWRPPRTAASRRSSAPSLPRGGSIAPCEQEPAGFCLPGGDPGQQWRWVLRLCSLCPSPHGGKVRGVREAPLLRAPCFISPQRYFYVRGVS